jgi:hypothetical protein
VGVLGRFDITRVGDVVSSYGAHGNWIPDGTLR